MERLRFGVSRCLMFVGLLLCGPGVLLNAAPVPPVKCDIVCQEKKGPFQKTVADDNTAKCWYYEEPTCTNCRSGQGATPDQDRWACVGVQSPNGGWCAEKLVDNLPDPTSKVYIKANANGVRCTKRCDQFLNNYEGQERVQASFVVEDTEVVEIWICGQVPPVVPDTTGSGS